MDMSEDCWDHVGLLQEVSAAEPPPPPPASDFLMQHQETQVCRMNCQARTKSAGKAKYTVNMRYNITYQR
ncbi:hypothetical protein ALC62_04986 [Cyphomyrmex costatus]|uniref:Uncharacterized protein n=1 Tax=Cyphomyrmex costatus TaxID=456900 RepID=A0A195CU87_9HYME|nr:hypothetical protein ALC62_04986 [Cyphomyrmex costatus]